LASAFWTALGPSLKGASAGNVIFQSVTAVDLGQDPNLVGVYTIPAGQVGTLAGDPLPANSASVLSWKTPYADRKRRGRTYWYGNTEAQMTGSTISSVYVLALTAIGTALMAFTNSGGIGVEFAVFSRVGNFITRINNFVIDNIADSQRRRLPQRGA